MMTVATSAILSIRATGKFVVAADVDWSGYIHWDILALLTSLRAEATRLDGFGR